MAARAQSDRLDDPLHRAVTTVWHAVRVAAIAVARLTVAALRWCWGTDDDDRKPRLSRAERKRLRKEKLREVFARKHAV